MPQATPDGFAPGRTTTITFDLPDYSLAQPPFWKSLKDHEITGNAIRPLTSNVTFYPGIGFRLDHLHRQMSQVHETNAAASVHINLAANLAAYAADALKEVCGLTGVPTGTQNAGDYFNQKYVGAGDDWSASTYILSADATNHPGPSDAGIVPMDRVFVDTGNPMQPDEPVVFRFFVPSLGGGASVDQIARLYFTGLAGSTAEGTDGNGQYCLVLRGDGRARLDEQLADLTWTTRRVFQWSPTHQVAAAWHMIVIQSDAHLGDEGKWQGSAITFTMQSVQDSQTAGIKLSLGLVEGLGVVQYVVPQTKAQHITPHPIRLDVRRNVRMKISLSRTLFFTPGTLQTQTWNMPTKPGAVDGYDPPFQVTCYGSFTGTSLGIALYGVDGTACAENTTVTNHSGSNATSTWKSFNRLTKADGTPQQEYYALLTFTASADQKKSPTVTQVDFIRNGAVTLGASTPFVVPVGAATDYSILGPAMDPTLETASIGLISLQDGFTLAANGVDDPLKNLKGRSGQSCLIEINIPSTTINGHAATTSSVFLGKVAKLRRKLLGTPVRGNYPSPTWWQGKITLLGLWKRLTQAKTTQTFNYGQKDPDTGQIYAVTKVVKLLTSNMGLPDKMLDIPQYPITLQADPSDKNATFQLEVYSETFQWCLQLVRDYLGGAIVIDANATSGADATDKSGCVRLKLPPRPDANGKYPPVAKFVRGPTWTDGIRSHMNLGSYAAVDRGDGIMIPVCPVIGHTVDDEDEPPEGNCVYVSGTAAVKGGGSLSATSGQQQLWAILHNWPAATFYDGQPIACDPTHPDYTDGSPNLIVIIDPSLNTQESVNFACRRVFDLACHRREIKSFVAPALLVQGADPNNPNALDPLQIRPRPLMWGDCVIWQGDDGSDETWFVSNVVLDTTGEEGGTRNAKTVYQLFRVPQLQAIDDAHASVYQSFALYGPIAGNAA